jgi:phosphatidylglycerophosphate synthase
VPRDWFTPGNGLSAGRLLLGLGFPLLPVDWWLPAAIVGAASDAVDGALSRSTGTTSLVGRFLDPVADKLFVLGILGTLLTHQRLTGLELLGLCLRDLAVGVRTGWIVLRRDWAQGRRARPTWLGKAATAMQFACLIMLLWTGGLPGPMLLTTSVVSGWAGLDYLLRPLTPPPDVAGVRVAGVERSEPPES